MHSTADQISLNTRLASIVIDQAVMIFLCLVAVAPAAFLVEGLSPFLSEAYGRLSTSIPIRGWLCLPESFQTLVAQYAGMSVIPK